ncbi:cation:proton antiporter [Salegentibacter salegens]|uniref:Sodium/proton antiporter, CPA1 family n=1 Tax=Salegentibacter salegens TaxID=143223 RepID=A0A1M7NC68_9FLAO|nr:cation:proton antiporter [Salegentibacter salegens]PRX42947.1 NhaP-type Na+/H+ or K+/H+ antiporter [Salegentibacter salegens]SHN01135.1 sodium/proton antiporter, CPA1 family [Salegentibacter salegens]
MKEHYWILAGIGFTTLIMAWLPSISKKIKVSGPIILLLIGFLLLGLGLPIGWPDPLWADKGLMYFSEMIVIISLMGAGLKIGNNYSFKAWKRPFLLVFLTMPLCMISAYFLGQNFLFFSVPSSLLLAAVLAPTDPVLAAETQLDDPEREKEYKGKIRFSLTAEAGLNDGLAFPFTYMAVLVAQAGGWAAFDFTDWMLDKFFLKIIIGTIAGFAIGNSIGFILDKVHKYTGIKTFDGFLALSLTLFSYGATELLHGYGFLAVFFAGLSLRHFEKVSGDYKTKMHDFIHEIERILLVVWIILFGGSIMNGMLSLTDWRGIVFAFAFVLIIRPLAGIISMTGIKDSFKNKLAISFLGIKGIGSVFYLAWAFVEFEGFEHKNEIYSITAYIILISIVVHGFTAPSIIEYFKRKTEQDENESGETPKK